MICVTLFCTLRESENTRTCKNCTLNRKHTDMRELHAKHMHVSVFSDLSNVQKRATKSDTSGHCLYISILCLMFLSIQKSGTSVALPELDTTLLHSQHSHTVTQLAPSCCVIAIGAAICSIMLITTCRVLWWTYWAGQDQSR